MTAPEPGPLADEAARLVEAVRDWAARTFPDADQRLATGAAECRYCPICQAVAALRGERPEVTDRLADAVTAAAGALAAVADALVRPPAARPSGPAESKAHVQPIRVDLDSDGRD